MAVATREAAKARKELLAVVAAARPVAVPGIVMGAQSEHEAPRVVGHRRQTFSPKHDHVVLDKSWLPKLTALGDRIPGVVDAVVAQLVAEQKSAAEAEAAHARAQEAAQARACTVLDVSRWCVRTVARAPACDGAEVAALRINDAERATLRCAFLEASPLMAAFSWRGREADSADPLVLRAPDGAEWWWNAETLLAAERTLLDLELGWLNLSPDAHSTRDVLPMVKLYKLLFAFFPGHVLRNEPVEQIERVLIDWLRAQKTFTSDDVKSANLALDAPLGLAIELLHADESRAVREAAARSVARAAPALLARKDGVGLRSDACAEECCRALSSEATATLKKMCHEYIDHKCVRGVLFLAKAAISAGCTDVEEACLDALMTRYSEVMRQLVQLAAQLLHDAVRPHVAVLSKLFVHTHFDPFKWGDPMHVLLVDAVASCAAELNAEVPELEAVKRNAVRLAASDLLKAVPLARHMLQDSWRAICAEAAAENCDAALAAIAASKTMSTLIDSFVFMTGRGGLDVDDALPVAALQELASCMGPTWSLSPELAQRAAQHLTVPALVRLLRATNELHAWPETFDLAFNVLQKCDAADGSPPDGPTLAEDALGSLNLSVLTTTTWPLAVRQALDVEGASEAFAAVLHGYLRRLQEEEPAEQSAARAAWSEMSARLSSSSTPRSASAN